MFRLASTVSRRILSGRHPTLEFSFVINVQLSTETWVSIFHLLGKLTNLNRLNLFVDR